MGFSSDLVELLRIVEANPPSLRRLRARLNELLGRQKDHGLDEALAHYFLSTHRHITRDEVMLPEATDIHEVAQVTPLVAGTKVNYQPAFCLTTERPAALPSAPSARNLPSIDGYESKVCGFELSFKFDIPICFHHSTEQHCIVVPLSSPGYDAIYIRGGRSAYGEADIVLNKVGIIYDHFVGNNYCHWLLDWLPRLYLIQQMGTRISELSFVFPRVLEPFQRQMLAAFEIGDHQIIEVANYGESPRSVVACRSVVATSTLRRSYVHALHGGSPWASQYLRSTLATAPIPDTSPLRLVINRRHNRRLIFSVATDRLLEATGFIVIYLEDLSFSEQIKLFRRAERVIGAHGAGLANLVFCQETAHVLEIFPPGYSTSAYWMVSHAVGFDYSCAIGETIAAENAKHVRNHDIFCSYDIVSDWIDKIS